MNLTETSCCHTKSCAPKPEETTRVLRPAISSRETDDGVHLHVALPGVRKEDLKLTVHQGQLTIEAERAGVTPGLRYSVTVKLADRLDGDRIQATLEDGVLDARLPLKEEAKPREIPIS